MLLGPSGQTEGEGEAEFSQTNSAFNSLTKMIVNF